MSVGILGEGKKEESRIILKFAVLKKGRMYILVTRFKLSVCICVCMCI